MVIFSLLALLFPFIAAGQVLVDGTVATVGTRVVLHSDIEQELLRLRLQGTTEAESDPCHVLEDLLVHYLFLDQADLDSVADFRTEADQEVDHRISMFLQQVGSEAELERQYGRSMREIRREMSDLLAGQRRAQAVRQSIVKDIKVTPSQVEKYYAGRPEDSLELVAEKYIYRQLVLKPVASAEADYHVRERLLELRERIIQGERFSTLAMAYSEDRSSAVRGGEMGFLPKESLVKPFADAAWALQEGQVSPIVKTEFGYHIIQMIERKGDLANLRHILLKPAFTAEHIQATIERLDSIRGLILHDTFTFEQACRMYSDDEHSSMSGGYAVNPRAGGIEFRREEMLPVDYFALQRLQPGQVSEPFESRDLKGDVVVKIVQLERAIPAHRLNLEMDYAALQQLARADLENKKIERWLAGKRASLYIRLEPEYRGCKFRYPFWHDPAVAKK